MNEQLIEEQTQRIIELEAEVDELKSEIEDLEKQSKEDNTRLDEFVEAINDIQYTVRNLK